jgi:hypothetical protein
MTIARYGAKTAIELKVKILSQGQGNLSTYTLAFIGTTGVFMP